MQLERHQESQVTACQLTSSRALCNSGLLRDAVVQRISLIIWSSFRFGAGCNFEISKVVKTALTAI